MESVVDIIACKCGEFFLKAIILRQIIVKEVHCDSDGSKKFTFWIPFAERKIQKKKDLCPGSKHFTERDRIQSGLTRGVVVIETDLASATMHTVRFAMEQRKSLACVNNGDQIILPSNEGNRILIEQDHALR